MKIVVVGGKLQGTEAVYLAHKAGWEATLIDKNPRVPAVGLCDQFFRLDVCSESERLAEIMAKADLVIPALEDREALEALQKAACLNQYPLVFDDFCYAISSSKRKSDMLFAEKGIPAPSYWPRCGFPVIIKPSGLSGSTGVKMAYSHCELNSYLAGNGSGKEDWVIQEFLEGDSYSLEVIGCNGDYRTLQVTDLEMDQRYDCKRVLAPTKLRPEQEKEFYLLGEKIARMINLQGIMDVEVIDHRGVLKVLEIDARLPSQTPTAVYKSRGINMLTILDEVYNRGHIGMILPWQETRAVIYEHLLVTPGKIECTGEHIMSDGGPMRYFEDFFGADEAITNFEPGRNFWAATLINTGSDREEVWAKRMKVIENIQKHFKVPCYIDSVPSFDLGANRLKISADA